MQFFLAVIKNANSDRVRFCPSMSSFNYSCSLTRSADSSALPCFTVVLEVDNNRVFDGFMRGFNFLLLA